MNLSSIIAFIIPALGTFGQSVATTYFIFALSCLVKLRITTAEAFEIAKKFRLEIVFLFWLFLSCFWAIHLVKALTSFLKLALYCGLTFMLFYYRYRLYTYLQKLPQFVLYGIFVGIALFYVEFWQEGIITKNFRMLLGSFGGNKNITAEYHLHLLDKGCTFLAIMTWPVVIYLLDKYKAFWALLFYIFIVFTLYLSDSLSGFVALLLSGVVYLLMRFFCSLQKPAIPITLLIIGAMMQIYLFYIMDPWYLATNYDFSQLSMIHRLFIWNYVAIQSANEFLFGYGFTSSKFFPVPEADYIYYQGVELMPLPLHPHNNILQILFENGLVGLFLYLAVCSRYLKLISASAINISMEKAIYIVPCGYAYFATYFIISMIAFSTWQSWWLAAIMFSSFVYMLNVDRQKSVANKRA